MSKKTVLLFGGNSDERLVSVASSQNLSDQADFGDLWYFHPDGSISRTLKSEIKGHERPFELEFRPQAKPFAKSLEDAVGQLHDATVFLGFHGTEGEDGQMQALLENVNIPFTGSGSKASGLCFDKLKAKEVVARVGVATASQIVVDANDHADAAQRLTEFFRKHGKIVVKPVASGSSFGLFIVTDPTMLQKAIDGIKSLKYGKFLSETFIQGRELTVGVWNDGKKTFALPPSEVLLNSGRSFDYEGKYLGQGTTEITPAELDARSTEKAQQVAIQAHQSLGCYGYSRTDMILTPTGPVFLETNTLPGMTRASFFPQQLEAAGFKMQTFIESQIELAGRRYL